MANAAAYRERCAPKKRYFLISPPFSIDSNNKNQIIAGAEQEVFLYTSKERFLLAPASLSRNK
jgi:hypothetical protein